MLKLRQSSRHQSDWFTRNENMTQVAQSDGQQPNIKTTNKQDNNNT
jgi:hypothetical protein